MSSGKDKDRPAQGDPSSQQAQANQQHKTQPHQLLPKSSQQNVQQQQQHSSNPLAYTSQFDSRSNSSSQNNTLKANPKRKKKPQIQKNPSFTFQVPSPKYVYSVDDDLDEIEQDIEREYLEGYNDALRHRYSCLLYTSPSPRDA